MQISHDFIATKTCPTHQVQCNIIKKKYVLVSRKMQKV